MLTKIIQFKPPTEKQCVKYALSQVPLLPLDQKKRLINEGKIRSLILDLAREYLRNQRELRNWREPSFYPYNGGDDIA